MNMPKSLNINSQCPGCCASDIQYVSEYKSRSDLMTGKQVLKCKSCQLVFAHPLPDAQAWENYNNTYFESAHGGVNRAAITIAFHKAIARIRLGHLNTHLKKLGQTPHRVLEIGPGEGHFAEAFLSEFPEASYHVLESDQSVYQSLLDKGVDILESPKQKTSNSKYDLIVISHVLEHTLDPVSFLRVMTANLRKEGILFVEVPCLDNEYKKFHEPHVLFFSKTSLESTAEAAGFKNVNVTYHGDTVENIKRFELIRRILTKLALMMKIPMTLFLGPSKSVVETFDLNSLEALAVSLTRPYDTQKTQSRWLRMVAQRKG